MAKRSRERRLRFTREGWWVVAITLAVGFAAINTGHNLLFFGWGLLLAAIVTSGVLSEATLRGLALTPGRPDEARAGSRSPLPLELRNHNRRLPGLGVEPELDVSVVDEDGATRASRAPWVLRLPAGARREVFCDWIPTRRGEHVVTVARARTTYPFGFFEKRRTLRLAEPRTVLVWPARVELPDATSALLGRLGSAATQRVGAGDDFFSLRPFVYGDDPRRVHWRRSARTGALFTKEHEAKASRALVLELMLPAAVDAEARERALACLGSIAEDLLSSGCSVGVVTAGVALAPASGTRQRSAILSALAACDASSPHGALPRRRGVAHVGVALPRVPPPAGVDDVLDLDERTLERAA
jgi:uncharacterized protein (DUF58 family)